MSDVLEDIEPGVKVRGRATGTVYTVVGPHPEKPDYWATYQAQSGSLGWSSFSKHLFEIVPKFEVGKVYEYFPGSGWTFKVEHVTDTYVYGLKVHRSAGVYPTGYHLNSGDARTLKERING